MAWKNCFFFSLLLGWVAVPLIVLRDSELLQSNWCMPLFSLVCVILVFIWFRSSSVGQPSIKAWPIPSIDLYVSLFAIAVVTLVAFYIPQRKHFWGGFDDFSAYEPAFLRLWSKKFDIESGRPFLGWSYFFGRALGSGRIDGFIAFAGLICFANATILCVYIRSILPNAKALALASALLLIVNRSDPLKFFPLWAASPYGLAVGLLLLAMWLFHASWCIQNRGLLLLSCASLGATLLMYEVGYLLAMIPLLAMWILRKQNPLYLFWATSWIGTLCLFAIRVLIFQLTNKSSYQFKQASESQLSLEVISRNTLSHLKPIELYGKVSEFTSSYSGIALLIFFVVAASVWWVGQNDKKFTFRVSLLVPILSMAGVILAIAPYSHIAGVERTQFFASPFQAVLVVFTIGLVGYYLPKLLAPPGLGIVIGLLAANATVESYHLQDRKFHVTYDKTVHVCQQILALSSKLTDHELVVLLHKEPSPIGVSYGVFSGSPYWTGAHIVPIGEDPKSPMQIEFQEDSAIVFFLGVSCKRYSYEHLLVCRLDQDGTLYFETKWPADSRIPQKASGYDPLKLISSSRIVLPTDFNFPASSGPPNDVVRQRDGILFGRGWSSLKFENGWLYRVVKQDAELIVNSQGKSHVEFDIDLGPCNQASEPNGFEVLNSRQEVVQKGEFGERDVVHMNLPCSPKQLEVFRIHSLSNATLSIHRSDVFKAFCKQGTVFENPLPVVDADITVGGLELGTGWYPRELLAGQAHRWLDTDGKLLTGYCVANESPGILLEIAPGPGMNGNPCALELCDEDTILASRTITSKEEWTIKLPIDFPQESELILRVNGGGKKIESDPRILNLIVTRCEWQPRVIEPPDILKGRLDLGTGWYPYEFFDGEHFRWLNTHAQIIYQTKEPVVRSSLVLDVSPGPGLKSTPGVIEVVDSRGKVLASGRFDQRTQLTLQLDDLAAGRNILVLRVVGGGNTIPNDPRILNVQVFQCEWRIDTD